MSAASASDFFNVGVINAALNTSGTDPSASEQSMFLAWSLKAWSLILVDLDLLTSLDH